MQSASQSRHVPYLPVATVPASCSALPFFHGPNGEMWVPFAIQDRFLEESECTPPQLAKRVHDGRAGERASSCCGVGCCAFDAAASVSVYLCH